MLRLPTASSTKPNLPEDLAQRATSSKGWGSRETELTVVSGPAGAGLVIEFP
jgi:hypothetical protein